MTHLTRTRAMLLGGAAAIAMTGAVGTAAAQECQQGAGGAGSLACGPTAIAEGPLSVAIGDNASTDATAVDGVAIGGEATATGPS
ncbi:hypothetical protein, partial [Paracoccus marcusii]